MIFPKEYKCLSHHAFHKGDYKIIPIRFEDHKPIMEWRNDQIDLLRQSEKLTTSKQVEYFSTVVKSLFNQDQPPQILMSFFENDKLIGYGGLVHIDWKSLNAEISFLLDSAICDERSYLVKFPVFLNLIQQLAVAASLHKIYSYGYRIVDYRFQPLIDAEFELEANLKRHKKIHGNLYDVLIYSKILE